MTYFLVSMCGEHETYDDNSLPGQSHPMPSQRGRRGPARRGGYLGGCSDAVTFRNIVRPTTFPFNC